MKARIIRGDIEVSRDPDQLSAEWMELTDIREILRNGSMVRRAFWKVGAILGGPGLEDCWMLVQQGCAEPADDECDARAGRMTRERLAEAQHAYERVSRGIAPEDYERFDKGEIVGYNPDGTDKPGPNWVPPVEETDEEDDE